MRATILSIFLLITNISFGQIFYTFNGNGDWSDATNWDVNGIPPNPTNSNDIVIIQGDCTLDINQTINGLTSISANSNFTVANTLTTSNAVTNDGTVSIGVNGSWSHIISVFTNNASFIANGTFISMSTFDNTANGDITVNIGGNFETNSLATAGIMTIFGDSAISDLNIDDGTVVVFGTLFCINVFINGSLTIASGGIFNTSTIDNYNIFSNAGVSNIQSEYLYNDGTFTLALGGELNSIEIDDGFGGGSSSVIVQDYLECISINCNTLLVEDTLNIAGYLLVGDQATVDPNALLSSSSSDQHEIENLLNYGSVILDGGMVVGATIDNQIIGSMIIKEASISDFVVNRGILEINGFVALLNNFSPLTIPQTPSGIDGLSATTLIFQGTGIVNIGSNVVCDVLTCAATGSIHGFVTNVFPSITAIDCNFTGSGIYTGNFKVISSDIDVNPSITFSPGSSPGVIGFEAIDANSSLALDGTFNMEFFANGDQDLIELSNFGPNKISIGDSQFNLSFENGYTPALNDELVLVEYQDDNSLTSNVNATINFPPNSSGVSNDFENGVLAAIISDTPEPNVGINTSDPKSALHVGEGSIFIEQFGAGLIIKASDGTCYVTKISTVGGGGGGGGPQTVLGLEIVPCPDE